MAGGEEGDAQGCQPHWSGSEVSTHFASSSRRAGSAVFAAAAARMTPRTGSDGPRPRSGRSTGRTHDRRRRPSRRPSARSHVRRRGQDRAASGPSSVRCCPPCRAAAAAAPGTLRERSVRRCRRNPANPATMTAASPGSAPGLGAVRRRSSRSIRCSSLTRLLPAHDLPPAFVLRLSAPGAAGPVTPTGRWADRSALAAAAVGTAEVSPTDKKGG